MVRDSRDKVLTRTDPENHTTTYAYDALSRTTEVTQPLGQSVHYVYDARDRLDYTLNARGQKLDYDYEDWGPVKNRRDYPSAPPPPRTERSIMRMTSPATSPVSATTAPRRVRSTP
jgi:YD repeat-containing protein